MGPGMRGGGGRRHQGTAKMPPGGMKTVARMLKMLLGNYKWSLLLVAVCILVTTATTLTSTLFTRTLIDDYIAPLSVAANPDFGPLAVTLFKLAAEQTGGNLSIQSTVGVGTEVTVFIPKGDESENDSS